MPRASMNPDRARQGGGGVEAGNYEVIAASYKNVKTDYKPKQPSLVLSCAVLDKDGDKVRGAEDVEIFLNFGEKAMESFHPGQADSPNDEPDDQGDDVDAEGNTMYCAEEGAQFNASCGAIVFSTSLVKAGFPKDILDRCWAPDLVGLKFRLESKTSKELNEKFGTRLSTKPTSDGNTVTYKICDKWLNPNYLSNGSGGGKKPGGSAAAKESSKPTDPEEIAKDVLAKVAAEKAGSKNKFKTKQALVGFFTNVFTKAKYDVKLLAKAQGFVKDEDWLIGAVAELGGTYDDGVTEFAEVE